MIVGIDPSYRALGLVGIPADWAPGTSATLVATVLDAGSADPIDQRRRLWEGVIAFLRITTPSAIFMEAYATHGVVQVGPQAELAGVLKDRIFGECGIRVRPVNIASSRKLLLGKLPQGKGIAKKVTLQTIQHFWPEACDARADALTVGNFGRSDLGLTCMVGEPPPKPPKRESKRRKRLAPDLLPGILED